MEIVSVGPFRDDVALVAYANNATVMIPWTLAPLCPPRA